MQSFYPERFTREMSCTEAEWLRLLPRAMGEHAWEQTGPSVTVRIGTGTLGVQWQALAPRTLGLVRLERLQAEFVFSGVDDRGRLAFMRRFDLYTQRGGG